MPWALGVGPWKLTRVSTIEGVSRVVAALLVVWEPANFAVEALTVLPTIAYRGWLPGLELIVHAVVAAVAAAGGLALWNRTAGAPRLALIAIVATVARTIQSLYWSVLPNATMPGDEPLIAAIALALGAAAVFIVSRSTRSAAL
jgi:hypothetical protein